MDSTLKNQILSQYLSHQMSTAVANNTGGTGGGALPTPEELEEFKNCVKAWIDMDNNVKKLQQAMRERNAIKKQITEKITNFMSKFNIEDLNTKDGKLRYRVTQVKVTPKPTEIKTKLIEYFSPETTAEELTKKIFDNNTVVEKHSLRRFK
jgi:hypothetical protein